MVFAFEFHFWCYLVCSGAVALRMPLPSPTHVLQTNINWPKKKNTKADLIVSVTFVFNLKHIFLSMEPNRTELGQWATACKTLLMAGCK